MNFGLVACPSAHVSSSLSLSSTYYFLTCLSLRSPLQSSTTVSSRSNSGCSLFPSLFFPLIFFRSGGNWLFLFSARNRDLPSSCCCPWQVTCCQVIEIHPSLTLQGTFLLLSLPSDLIALSFPILHPFPFFALLSLLRLSPSPSVLPDDFGPRRLWVSSVVSRSGAVATCSRRLLCSLGYICY